MDDGAARKAPGFIQAVVLDDKTATASGWVVAVAETYEGAKAATAVLKIDCGLGPYAKVDDAALSRARVSHSGLDAAKVDAGLPLEESPRIEIGMGR